MLRSRNYNCVDLRGIQQCSMIVIRGRAGNRSSRTIQMFRVDIGKRRDFSVGTCTQLIREFHPAVTRAYDAGPMKVLNLRCANGHGFEGWFASDDEFMDQNGRGLIECPLCADRVVSRMPSAPRLNLSGAREPAAAPTAEPAAVDLQAAWLNTVRHMLANTEDVGERFPEEARRIHYGETPNRGIRGEATPDERQALNDEGIEVMAIPLPRALKGPIQ